VVSLYLLYGLWVAESEVNVIPARQVFEIIPKKQNGGHVFIKMYHIRLKVVTRGVWESLITNMSSIFPI